MEKAAQRLKILQRDLKKIKKKIEQDDSDDDGYDDLDDAVAIRIELEELKQQSQARQAKLDEYEKNKKWNVDNMFEVKEERTVINANAAKTNYTPAGFAQSTVTGEEVKKQFMPSNKNNDGDDKEDTTGDDGSEKVEAKPAAKVAAPAAAPPAKTRTPAGPATVGPAPPKANGSPPDVTEVDSDPNFVYSYHEFTEKYSAIVEEFMTLTSFDESKEFLLKHGGILLQEHACNYLLLASLEDEMNGYREKMKQTAKQSQIVTNIAELAKSWNTHPGNVIVPFFQRMQQREFLEGFLAGLEVFVQKIISRAVTKKIEMDQARSSGVEREGVDLAVIPKEERLGPGGLDPLEVIETLPESMQKAFESRDVDELKEALLKLDPKDAEYHMKRCVASGLWNAG